ncbi:PAS domain-containing protein, partial [Patescibacteria group bacterium]
KNMLREPSIFECTIIDRKKVAENTTEVSFRVNEELFAFEPGQYIRLTIQSLKESVSGGNTRDFTIASSPSEKGVIRITFRNSESAFKKSLLSMSMGSNVQAQGPLGIFTLPEGVEVPIVFVAGGVGVTPALSMLRFINDNKTGHNIQIIYANSSRDKAAHIDEMLGIAKNNSGVRIVERVGRVNVEFIGENVDYTDETLWYLCGVPEMTVALMRDIPNVLDVSQDNIRIEEYVGYDKNRVDYRAYPPVNSDFKEMSFEESLSDKELIKSLFDAVGEGALIAITDTQGSIQYVNDKFIEISGYSKDELIGQNHRIIKSGAHPPVFYDELWRTISSGDIWRGELKNRAKDGSFYWVDSTITPIFDKNSKVKQYLAVRFLITDKKQLEESERAMTSLLEDIDSDKKRLEVVSERLSLATESASIGVWEWDIKKDVFMWDEQMCNLYGMKKKGFRGRYSTWKKCVHPDDIERLDAEVEDAVKGVRSLHSIFRVIWPNESVHYLAVRALISDEKGGESGKMIGVSWDVTIEQEIDKAKTEFVSLASHQLRTPLSSMGWNAQMLLAGDAGELTEEQKEFIEEIYGSSQIMNNLVNALLNTSRIDLGTFSIEPEDINFEEIARSVLKELEPQIKEKKQNLEENFEKLPLISADPQLLRIVFQNLLSNAIKYTPEDGKIGVSISKKDNDVLIVISDTGYGIPKKQQQKIFSKLFRAENIISKDVEGTGLGLYIVKAIIDVSGGKIWFESEENKGATFYVTIPLSGMKKKDGNKGLS